MEPVRLGEMSIPAIEFALEFPTEVRALIGEVRPLVGIALEIE